MGISMIDWKKVEYYITRKGKKLLEELRKGKRMPELAKG